MPANITYDFQPRTAAGDPMNDRARALLTALLTGGLLAATLDIGAACLINGRSVTFILHSIAGGLLAERAFSGGTPPRCSVLRCRRPWASSSQQSMWRQPC
jgi:hypothetical protein